MIDFAQFHITMDRNGETFFLIYPIMKWYSHEIPNLHEIHDVSFIWWFFSVIYCHPCQSDRSPKLFKERRPRDQETMATMVLPGGIYTSLGPFRGSWISGWLGFFLGLLGWLGDGINMINIWFSHHFWAEIWRSERMGHSDSKLFPAQMSWVPWGFGDRLKDRIIFFPSDNSDYLFWSGTSVSWCFFVLNISW